MKKNIIYFLLLFLSFSPVYGSSYDDAYNKFQKGKINESIYSINDYIENFNGAKDCRSYGLLSILANKAKWGDGYTKSYDKLKNICDFLKKGDTKKAIFLIENLNLSDWGNFNNLRIFYLDINILMYEYSLGNLDFIKNIFKFKNFIYKNSDGTVGMNLHKQGLKLLANKYLRNKDFTNFFNTIGKLDNYNIFIFIRSNDISKYKQDFIKLYGLEFYNFAYSYSQLEYWLVNEKQLEKEEVEKHYKTLSDYYKKNKDYIIETYGDYEIEDTYSFVENIYPSIRDNIKNIPSKLIDKEEQKKDIVDKEDNNLDLINKEKSIFSEYLLNIYISFILLFIIILIFIFKKNN